MSAEMRHYVANRRNLYDGVARVWSDDQGWRYEAEIGMPGGPRHAVIKARAASKREVLAAVRMALGVKRLHRVEVAP